jgi:lipase chaperone LimK
VPVAIILPLAVTVPISFPVALAISLAISLPIVGTGLVLQVNVLYTFEEATAFNCLTDS